MFWRTEPKPPSTAAAATRTGPAPRLPSARCRRGNSADTAAAAAITRQRHDAQIPPREGVRTPSQESTARRLKGFAITEPAWRRCGATTTQGP